MRLVGIYFLVICILFCSCGDSDKSTVSGTNENKNAVENTEQIGKVDKSDVESVVDYGTGLMPLSIKKAQEENLKKIQEEHNRKLEDVLKE